MPVNRKGFSLLEVLITMTISSILLLSTSRFYRGYSGGFTAIRSRSWRMRSGNVCSRSVNSFREQDTVQGIAGDRDHHRQARTMCDCAMGCEQQRPVG